MQQLSFTIPYTSSAIRGVITALNQMDNDLNGTVGLFEKPTRVVESPSFPTPTQMDSFAQEVIAPMTTPPPPPSVSSEQDEKDDELDEVQPEEGAVDSAGMLWDARIHSSSKAFLKSDGTWKLKKGVDKSLVAEILGNAQVQETNTTIPTQNNVSTPPPPVAPITETPPAPVGTGFRQLLSDITKAGLAPEYVQNMCLEVNGRPLPLCKDDMSALDLLRMSLGL